MNCAVFLRYLIGSWVWILVITRMNKEKKLNTIFNCTGHKMKIRNIVDSQGLYLFDEDGKRCMDLESGVWCTALGHKHPRINKIIKRQIDSLMHAGFCYSNEILEKQPRPFCPLRNSKAESVFFSAPEVNPSKYQDRLPSIFLEKRCL